MMDIDKILNTILTGSTAVMALAKGGVSRGIEPEAHIFPRVSFMALTAMDDYSFAGRADLQTQYQVQIIDRNYSAATVSQLANLVDAALQDMSGTTSDWQVIHCRREREDIYEKYEGNDCYQYISNVYNITVKPVKH